MKRDTDARIEALREMIDAIERGDREKYRGLVTEWIHPDCDWFPRLADVQGRSYKGPEGMVEWFDDFVDTFDARRYVETEFSELGAETLLILDSLELRGRESGVQMTLEIGAVWEFEDDLMRRGHAYGSHDEAVEAAEALVA